MPKVGMEPVRKQALILAAISEIGKAGSLDVTVSQIAKGAGVSPALAHHYFGSKEQIFLSTIRHVLSLFKEAVGERMARAQSPVERIHAIINASFDDSQFSREVISAWLAFYVRSLHSPDVKRLLQVYARRLHSNLMYNLRQIFDPNTAWKVAQGLASLIDGFYIRQALQSVAPDPHETRAIVTDYLDLWIQRKNA